ncbi:hypothetical protein ONE63_004538 [Megalurothrips usitatus]|uniref:Uncharacterized protein n=1 Tax=Megalurothrips usitatus TaxID=439358 RepID=A0AAV7X5M5_9NEOP|nr:hypothetical protein ONE63_004538 [Megalurothrips usitatus]
MLCLWLLVTVLGGGSCLNVLLVSTVSSPSHSIWARAVSDGLLSRGHRVTELVVRAPATEHPNRTSFVVTGNVYAEEHGWDLDELSSELSWTEEVRLFYDFCRESTNFVLPSEALQDLAKHLREARDPYDVFVLDYFMQEPFLGVSASLIGRPPVVAMTAYNLPEDIMELMGSPYLPSVVPHHYYGVGSHGGEPSTFKERVVSVVRWILFKTYFNWVYKPEVEDVIAKTFPGSPPLAELQRDVAVALVNTVPALHGALPVVPGIVQVGGLHARPAKPLPDHVLRWVDAAAAPHGFVFMSFGTNIKSAFLAKDRRDAILRAFGRLKQRVLWKYEDDDIQDKLPANVHVAKWLPQNDILGHSNIRCFVSHNGALSTQEASYHGVPILGVPFMVDQHGYAEKVERMGLGRRVAYTNITEDSFYEALADVIDNPRYRENMRSVQRALLDQKETPLERAVWWIEFAARSGGAPHLRSPALRLRWYELWMLDVLAAGALCAALAVWLTARAVRALLDKAGPRKDKQL